MAAKKKTVAKAKAKKPAKAKTAGLSAARRDDNETTTEFAEGAAYAATGRGPIGDNPYDRGTDECVRWNEGFIATDERRRAHRKERQAAPLNA